MPELPEVETTRRFLVPALEGRTITAVSIRRLRMVRRQARPGDFADRVIGCRIEQIDRHGKFLLAKLSTDVTWVTHLGMSGSVRLAVAGDPEDPHTNVVIRLDDATECRMVDPRTFGFVAAFLPDEMAAGSLAGLGPDALDDLPTTAVLRARMEGRAVPIKPLLLDQAFLAGLGNIYADEVLFRSGIAPSRRAGSLERDEVKRLRGAIRPILEAGLRHGGTSLDDLAYLLPDGRAGDYLSRLMVYGREDRPCRRCGTPIRRAVLRQRSTFWCPECQA
ncbi:MAG: bifunctional DNA-formamidopyrimidine glycosylase/DNA-(apurinic or apyrimidinic site) lyase [Actinobacteria bacterium]|nr:bifunctional DNA-formamidopyrimidine glycosylase/DNA-(apurinic or apyrimidinic site) lyase [Actinomycetota bacterium]MBU1492633.1 bifunctional DNA-formamidopyrimidine glycosylase/DNA-(apurinic or apyrimidinic site) lyase [Actinomycetota bacterium]MBU1866055.1 bifunctional DNA-formamidopyrimidine glycosylase/DNA-(apurinic or apyrimidinic site) lyase [Actinomycetota bacterium]